ncbi:MAG: protein-L-isoaspartate O-methyltransferase [Alphaproteobacteria bacterium]
MINLQQARKNMVDCQIRPNGVVMPELLEAFETVPRELFVPTNYRNMACNDEDIPLGEGRYLLEPAVHAKMLQALEPQPDDVVLLIGGGIGYGAAILSSLVSTVVVVESQTKLIEWANKAWDETGLCNIASFEGPLEEGVPKNAPYDSIVINGAVSAVPEQILAQLVPGGRLVCIVREAGQGIGQARLFRKSKDGKCSSFTLFDAGTPYLKGFEPKPDFRF